MNRPHRLFGVSPSISDSRRRDTLGSSVGIPQIDLPPRLSVEVICVAGLKKSFRCPIGIVSTEAVRSRIVDSKNPMVINLCLVVLKSRPMYELICQEGILIRVPRAEVPTVPRKMIWQGGRVSPAAENVGIGQRTLRIDLLRRRSACERGPRRVWVRVKPKPGCRGDCGKAEEKNTFH